MQLLACSLTGTAAADAASAAAAAAANAAAAAAASDVPCTAERQESGCPACCALHTVCMLCPDTCCMLRYNMPPLCLAPDPCDSRGWTDVAFVCLGRFLCLQSANRPSARAVSLALTNSPSCDSQLTQPVVLVHFSLLAAGCQPPLCADSEPCNDQQP